MERTVRNLGPALEPVLLPERSPQELANLFMQHGHQRRSYLQEPASSQLGLLDGMHISYFTATDSQSDSSIAPTDRALPHAYNAIVPASSHSAVGCRTFTRRKRCRNMNSVVLSDDDPKQANTSNHASTSHPQNVNAQASTNHQPDEHSFIQPIERNQYWEAQTNVNFELITGDIDARSLFLNRNPTVADQQVLSITFSIFLIWLLVFQSLLHFSSLFVAFFKMKIVSWNFQGI